jgi:hypothetical protein
VFFNLLSVQGNTADTIQCKWPSLSVIGEEHFPAGNNTSGLAFGDISLSEMKAFIQFALSHAQADLSYGSIVSNSLSVEGVNMMACKIILGPTQDSQACYDAAAAGPNRSIAANVDAGLGYFCIEETNYSLATHIRMYLASSNSVEQLVPK